MALTRSMETAPRFIFRLDLGLMKTASSPQGSEMRSHCRSASTGQRRCGVLSALKSALITMLGGVRSIVWFL